MHTHSHENLKEVLEQVPADYWDTSYAKNRAQKLYYDIRFSVVNDFLSDTKQNGKVLDVGCSSGFSLDHYKNVRPDFQCFGADMAEHHILYAREHRPKYQFVVAPAESLPFPDNTFDSVTMLDVIEHVVNPVKALREIYRVLKPGGAVIVSVVQEHHPLFQAIWWGWLKLKGKVWEEAHLRVYDKNTLVDDVTVSGFEPTKFRRSHGTMYLTVKARKPL